MSVQAAQVFHHLMTHKRIRAQAEGFGIDIQYVEDQQLLYMATVVFQGDGYLPKSVRAAITSNSIVASIGETRARLMIDEGKWAVVLIYSLPLDPKDEKGFDLAATDFIDLALEWRWMLDEYGQQDLIHVPV